MERDNEPAVGRGKIVYLITSALSSRLLRGQLDHLAERGFDIVVGTGEVDTYGVDGFDSSASVIDLGFHREIRLFADVSSLWHCIRMLRRERPDIVNYSTPKAGLIGALAMEAANDSI